MSDEMEFAPTIISLMDDEGQEYQFELLDEYEDEESGQRYLAVTPYHENPEEVLEDSDVLIVFKVTADGEDGEELLEEVVDDDEYERISAIFAERLDEEFEVE